MIVIPYLSLLWGLKWSCLVFFCCCCRFPSAIEQVVQPNHALVFCFTSVQFLEVGVNCDYKIILRVLCHLAGST